MRSLPKWFAVVAAGSILPLSALTASAAPAPQAGGDFAPYVDITQPAPTLPDIAKATGVQHFTAAFALGGPQACTPMWGGTKALDDPSIINQIKTTKDGGGEVTVATGGAAGPYLETSCTTADDLYNAYKKILDTTGSNSLDVDVESTINQDMVNEALAKLQTERQTKVTYTLRVQGDDFGVDSYSLQVLQSAAAHKVDVTVNPMTMDFGSSKEWGDAVISAAQAVLGQMKQVWPNMSDADLKSHLRVTPMIGVNDNGKVFTQDDAKKLVDWAKTNQIGGLAFWSAGRDNGSCAGGPVSPSCSSIQQADWEFSNIFKGFAA